VKSRREAQTEPRPLPSTQTATFSTNFIPFDLDHLGIFLKTFSTVLSVYDNKLLRQLCLALVSEHKARLEGKPSIAFPIKFDDITNYDLLGVMQLLDKAARDCAGFPKIKPVINGILGACNGEYVRRWQANEETAAN
jgi:hypothetical protein